MQQFLKPQPVTIYNGGRHFRSTPRVALLVGMPVEICRRCNINDRNKADLTKLIRKLKRESKKVGLYFNIKKTKIMTTVDWDTFEIDGEEIEVVTNFTFLGSEVEKEGRCDKEIKSRKDKGIK